MKKQFALMLFILVFATVASSKTIYVNSATGSDSKSGMSWDTALKSIPYALTVASTTGDNLWIAGGTYDIPGASTFTQGNTNMYGGFSGNETNLSARPTSDLDGNGIVEPWEFTNATILTFNVIDKNAINFTGAVFNGFTLTATATMNDNQSACVYSLSDWTTNFANNTIRNNNLTLSANTDRGGYYPFFKSFGIVNNCLFENNTVTVNASQFAYICPFITVNPAYHSNMGTKFLNTVIRNNTVTIDYSTAASGTNSYGVRALIMNVQGAMNPTAATSNKGGLPTTVANCIIHNNDMVYIPGSAASQLYDAAAIVTGASLNYWDGSANVKQPTTDSIINCTVANNKGVRINNGGINIMSDASSYHYIINNVFYNNQRATKGTNFQVSNMAQNNTQNAGLISNNFTDGGGLSNSANQIVKQDNTLGTGSNLPNFKKPTTVVGSTTDNSAEASSWTLVAGSYLIGKGIATSRSTDKAGVIFNTPRAIGAYGYNGSK
ncbi:MAG: hypothetical protein BGN96_05960 [Bacteroidales bacterium 45-6]|nr:MAG: hypothetical protein BGN96_05960 [Bacteroidales bacterium 45-6]